MRTMVTLMTLLALLPAASAQEGAAKVVDARATTPTLHCLGFEVVVEGDSDADAAVLARFRKEGDDKWREALPLLRVNPEAMVRPPAAGSALFAGSVLDLEPGATIRSRTDASRP